LDPLYLLSFPTRRSSDLARPSRARRVRAARNVRDAPQGETDRDEPTRDRDGAHADGDGEGDGDDDRHDVACVAAVRRDDAQGARDRKSTRLNSSHVAISY